MKKRFRIAAAMLLAGLALAAASGARAQSYPSRPVRIIIPNVPGGTTDILARLMGDKLHARFNQPVIVESKPGAGTLVGTDYVSKQPADGYTLLLTSTTITTLPSLYSNANYDPTRDFTSIAGVSRSALIVSLHKSVPARSISELIAYLKANPGTINAAVAGSGTFDHLAAEAFMRGTGTKITIVPYKGEAAAQADLVAGRAQMVFTGYLSMRNHIADGTFKALAVTSLVRSPFLPDVPTLAETVIPGYEAEVWFGIFGPAGIPRDIVSALNQGINDAQRDPDIVERYRTTGQAAFVVTPEQLADTVRRNYETWGKLLRDLGLKVQ